MGFRIQRRLNYGSGLGLNLSKSGAAPSMRTRLGTVGARGFSIRSGIPGLTYRKTWGKGAEGALIGILMFLVVGVINLAVIIGSIILKGAFYIGWFLIALIYNILCWIFLTAYDFFKYLVEKRKVTEQV